MSETKVLSLIKTPVAVILKYGRLLQFFRIINMFSYFKGVHYKIKTIGPRYTNFEFVPIFANLNQAINENCVVLTVYSYSFVIIYTWIPWQATFILTSQFTVVVT